VIIVDSGPLIAAASTSDTHHASCAAALQQVRTQHPMITPMVVTEVCYFLQTRADAKTEALFLRSIADGLFDVVDLTAGDLRRCADLVEQYGDFPLGVADASVIAVAERFNITTVLTLDQRHFNAVRPLHVDHFELLP
jgi:predicted nucleic acid-binding protein